MRRVVSLTYCDFLRGSRSLNSFLIFRTQKYGDEAPETADLYFSYGRALLENAITQSGVLGKDQPEAAPEDEPQGTRPLTSPHIRTVDNDDKQ